MAEEAENELPPMELSAPWRFGSSAIMGVAGLVVRTFVHGPNMLTAHGIEGFMDLLDRRKDVERRTRGLITVSNHISVIDDPLIWGALPYSHHFNPSNSRWSLASYDICFSKNKLLDYFWTLGQTLPTHRLQHSPYGGLFQPTMREAVRLLSRRPFDSKQDPDRKISPQVPADPDTSNHLPHIADPFSSPNDTYTFTTNGVDRFPCPSAYAGRQYSWIHIFPEGKIHQHPHYTMRYFKWGVARLILEPDECPDIVPMWIEGNDQIMHEARKFPRFLPRVGKQCALWIGDNVGGAEDPEGREDVSVFHKLRRRWQVLKQRDRERRRRAGTEPVEFGMGDLSDELKYGRDAVALREQCTMEVRQAVLAMRRKRGLPDEDPKARLVDTWREEGPRREGRMADGSIVKDT